MPLLCLLVGADLETERRLQREMPPCGVRPHAVGSCHAAAALLAQWHFDALLVDAAGFGGHVDAALRRLRRNARTPIVLIAPHGDEAAQLAWLEAGASDVVDAGVSARLLAAKLRRLVEAQSHAAEPAAELTVGPLAMNPRRQHASVDGQSLALTAHQFELLFLLASRLGQFVGRDEIARMLRSPDGGRSADVHVYRIRKKLRELGARGLSLDTVHGRGYCLSVTVADTGGFDGPDEFDDLDEGVPA